MTFSPGEYKTRDGRTARVVFQVSEPNTARYPLVGEVRHGNGDWGTTTWAENGDFYVGVDDDYLGDLDLMLHEQRQHTIVKVYRGPLGLDDLRAVVTITYSGDEITDVRLAEKPVLTMEEGQELLDAKEDDDNG